MLRRIQAWIWHRSAEKQGREDGIKGIPEASSPVQPIYEETLEGKANVELGVLAEKWAKKDGKYRAKCQRCYEIFENANQAQVLAKGAYDDAHRLYIHAENQFRALPALYMGKFAYFVMMAAVLMAEGYFNYKVFEIFGFGRGETIILSLSIVVGLPLCAHYIGRRIKEAKPWTWKELAFSGMVIIILTGTVGILSLLRQRFVSTLEMFDDKSMIADASVYIVQKFNLSPNELIVIFFFINLFLFMVGSVLAYLSGHPRQEELNTVRRNLSRAQKNMRKTRRVMNSAERRLIKAEEAFIVAHNQRENVFQELQSRAETEKEQWEQLMWRYRRANQSSRKNPTVTVGVFGIEPNVSLPPEFLLTVSELEGCLYCPYWNVIVHAPTVPGP